MFAGRGSSGPTAERESTQAVERFEPAAALLLAVLTILWSWWAVKQGAFFGTVLLPGTILLCATAILIALSAPVRVRLRSSRGALLALAALLGLGLWTALSAVWSPAPDVAIEDGQRVLTYGLAFGMGAWLCVLLGRRSHLAMVPLAVAGAFAGIWAVVGLLTGNHPTHYLMFDGTLEYPLGYRNANAAFFLIALWPALGLASRRETPWWLRGPALATATLCVDLGILSQSRASLIAGAAALCVYAILARDRARAVLWLALAVLPAVLTVPAVTDLYHTVNPGHHLYRATGDMHAAGRAAALTSVLALIVGFGASALQARIPISPRLTRIANRVTSAGLIVVALGGSIAFVSSVGDPLHWFGVKVAQFRSGQEANLSNATSRFVLNAGTGRGELWRVALVDAGKHPLLGDGAGGYRYSYLRERKAKGIPAVHDAHSVELENLSELGFPGLLLFVAAMAGAGIGGLRARRFGPSAVWLSAIALSAGTYWLVHASLDWFWPYPAVTAPLLALLGSACAPGLGRAAGAPSLRARAALIAGAAILAVSAIPPFLTERYVNQAYAEWRSNPQRAYHDLDRARSWNRLSVAPLLAEGAIARADGDRSREIEAFRQAIAKRPEDWAPYYFLAQVYRRSSPALARRELAAARRRDPHNAQIQSLGRKLHPASSG